MSGTRKPVVRRRRRADETSLVADLAAFVRRYVVMTPAQLLVVALWVVHTHCIEVADQTPYLAVTSPEKQCGKSRLLETLELVCARPWFQVLPSEAVLFRHVHNTRPTLLLDEVDTIFNPRSADRYEGHRALLNAGHRRGVTVPRCIGSSNKVAEFRVFCAKVLAGIGTLPDTVADRAIPIRLARRTREETIEKLRRRTVEPDAAALRQRISEWVKAEGRLEQLRDAQPVMPDELSDRMQDGCEILVAIADAAGCGGEARAALVELLTSERLDDQQTMRLRLLRDLRTIYKAKGMPTGMATATLLVELVQIEEAPWSSYYGRSFEARDLAALLGHYGIRSTTIRPPVVKKADRGKKPFRGYKRDDLYEAWKRYL